MVLSQRVKVIQTIVFGLGAMSKIEKKNWELSSSKMTH